VEHYFRYAEWSAEADRFDTPEELRDELEVRYGAAYWLDLLRNVGSEHWNIIDYYLAHFSGEFYTWSGYRPLHPGHRLAAVGLIEDLIGRPDEFALFDGTWRTPEVVEIAEAMYRGRYFSSMPALAEALVRAGCDEKHVLDHCRSGRTHARGCWAIDLILKKL